MLNIFKKNEQEESKLKGFSEKVQILKQEEERKVTGGDGGTNNTTKTSSTTGGGVHDNGTLGDVRN